MPRGTRKNSKKQAEKNNSLDLPLLQLANQAGNRNFKWATHEYVNLPSLLILIICSFILNWYKLFINSSMALFFVFSSRIK